MTERWSRPDLIQLAAATGFPPETLEKVYQLLAVLEAIAAHPFLAGRLALKGGTALNLFFFDVPRLSVDIDLEYLGAVEREQMLADRPRIEQALGAVFSRLRLAVRRVPTEHAGGKWHLRYASGLGRSGNLEVDVNFMLRVPLWPPVKMDSRPLGPLQARNIQVLDIHELAAGKLCALLDRTAGRDLFDTRSLFATQRLDMTCPPWIDPV